MHPVAALGDLQGHPLEGHAVVFDDDTLEGLTQEVIQLAANLGHEGRSLLQRWRHELGIEGRSIDFIEVAVSRCHVADAGDGQLLWQTPLVGTEHAL